eukprot:Partr_v1_DN27317_c0_g1_i2_m46540 putative CCR4-NOT transcription complex subunit 2
MMGKGEGGQYSSASQPHPSNSNMLNAPGKMPSNGTDRFGLMGLLGVIRMTDQDLNTLALGCDLTTLGLNLNAAEELFPTFISPWPEQPTDIAQPPIPACYTVAQIAPPSAKISYFTDETLLYIFYCMPQDELQDHAADELYRRNWRYHKDLKLWLTKDSNVPESMFTQTAQYEKGIYVFWDIQHWCRVSKEFVVYYDMLEARQLSRVNSASDDISQPPATRQP